MYCCILHVFIVCHNLTFIFSCSLALTLYSEAKDNSENINQITMETCSNVFARLEIIHYQKTEKNASLDCLEFNVLESSNSAVNTKQKANFYGTVRSRLLSNFPIQFKSLTSFSSTSYRLDLTLFLLFYTCLM